MSSVGDGPMDELSLDQTQVLTAFGDARPSRLSSHQSTYCTFAREALIGEFASKPDIASALSRIPERLPWGDTAWPSYWCDVAQASTGDSGVHAELAGCVMDRFGIQHREAKPCCLRRRALSCTGAATGGRREAPPAGSCRPTSSTGKFSGWRGAGRIQRAIAGSRTSGTARPLVR